MDDITIYFMVQYYDTFELKKIDKYFLLFEDKMDRIIFWKVDSEALDNDILKFIDDYEITYERIGDDRRNDLENKIISQKIYLEFEAWERKLKIENILDIKN